MRAMLAATVLFGALVTNAAQADVITDWNQTTAAVLGAAKVGGNPASRTLAIVHVAMSDAVNAVQPRYTRYLSSGATAPGASPEVAAAAAARHVLIQLYPAQKQMIEDAFVASTKGTAEGGQKQEGEKLGEQIAAAVLADRASDGTTQPETYRPFTKPGVWVPTTPPIDRKSTRLNSSHAN